MKQTFNQKKVNYQKAIILLSLLMLFTPQANAQWIFNPCNSDGTLKIWAKITGFFADDHCMPEPQPPINTAPTILISSPGEGVSIEAGTEVSFTGVASDAEDGNLSDNIQWSSSIDGAINNSATLSEGTHTITATISDSGGLSANAQLALTVTPLAPPSDQTTEQDSQSSDNSSLNISWAAPTSREDGSSLPYSEISGYEISIVSESTGNEQLISLDDPNSNSYTTSSLTPDTYQLSIYTIDNDGYKSSPSIVYVSVDSSGITILETGNFAETDTSESTNDQEVAGNDNTEQATNETDQQASSESNTTGSEDLAGQSQTSNDSTITLSWEAPNTRADGSTLAIADISGYEINIVDESTGNSQVIAIDDPGVTSYTTPALDPDTYHISISTIDTAGMKSSPSKLSVSVTSSGITTTETIADSTSTTTSGTETNNVTSYESSPENTGSETNDVASNESEGTTTTAANTNETNNTEEQSVSSTTSAPGSATITVSWVAPTTRADGSILQYSEISGYEIYIIAEITGNDQIITINNPATTSYTTSPLNPDTYYLSISTIDNNGLKSTPTELFTKTID